MFCCHDKRLCSFFPFPNNFSLKIRMCSVSKFGCCSQKCSKPNRNFENLNFQKLLSLNFIVYPVLTPLKCSHACVGRFEYANPGECHILDEPINCRITSYLQVVIHCSIISLQKASETEFYPCHLNSPRVTNGIILHVTAL